MGGAPSVAAPLGAPARRLTARVAGEMLDDLDALSMEIAELLHAELAELGHDDETFGDTLASTRANVDQATRLLREGADLTHARAPAEAIAYANEYAHRGLSLATLLSTYRIGHEAYYDEWQRRLRSDDESPAETLEAVGWVGKQVFGYINAVVSELTTVYLEERERWARTADAVRATAVRQILDGETVDVHEASARLRHQLDRPQLAFVIWSDERGPDSHRERELAAQELAALLGTKDVMLVPLAVRLLAGWVTGAAATRPLDPLARLQLDVRPETGIRAAFGTPHDGVAGFRESHLEALRARHIADLSCRRPGSVTRYENVSLVALASENVEHARAFVARELGALAAGDDATRRIVATLRVYFDEHHNRARTARRLGVHANTVTYRIGRARELLGRDFDERPLELHVALALEAVLRVS